MIAAGRRRRRGGAVDPRRPRPRRPAAGGGLATKVDRNAGVGTRIRQWLMTGVSYMIPFVAAGGILIALGFMLAQFAGGVRRRHRGHGDPGRRTC